MATQNDNHNHNPVSAAPNEANVVDSEKPLHFDNGGPNVETEKPVTVANHDGVPDLERLGSDSDTTNVGQPEITKPAPGEINGETLKGQNDDESTAIRWTFSRIVAFTSLCFVYTGSQIILYFTAGALVYIQVDIGTQLPNWLLTANTLSTAATLPFVGHITDLLGRRWVCLLGSLLLIVASAVMGTSQTFASSLVAQCLGGIGTGITELTALAGVAEIVPVKWRGVALAIVNLSLLPFIPYLIYIVELQQAGTWRWVFLIIGLWNLIGLIGIIFCYQPPPRHNVDGLSKMEIIKRIDYVGFVLSFGGITMLLVALQAGGYQYPWTSAKVLPLLIIGIVMVLLFPLWEWKFPKQPLVPIEIFQGQRVVALAYAIGFIGGMSFFALLGFYPVIIQKMFISTPITVGIRSLGLPLGLIIGGMVTNVLLSYSRGHVRWMFFIAATMMTAFMGALAASTPNNPRLVVAIATIASFGVGAFLIPALALSLYACPDRFIGTAAALALTVRFLGASIGTAIFYNIFNTKLMKLLPQYVASAVVPLGLPPSALPSFLQAFSAPDPNVAVIAAAQVVQNFVPDQPRVMQIIMTAGMQSQLALAKSLSYVWYATVAFGVVAMIVSLLLPNIREFMTKRVAVVLR